MSSAPPSKRRGNHYACRIAALPTHIASTRRLLAKWILVLGKQGERDRNQFVEKALALLADSNPKAREFLTGGSSALPRSIVETSWNLTLASRVQHTIGESS